MDSYLRLTLERDVKELSNVRRSQFLRSVLARVAGQTAQMLNVDNVTKDIVLEYGTTANYITLLERVFLLYLSKRKRWALTQASSTLAAV